MFDEITAIMQERGIKISELSEATGIKPRTLYNILESKDNFEKTSYANVVKIKNALRINDSSAVVVNGEVYILTQERYELFKKLLEKLKKGQIK